MNRSDPSAAPSLRRIADLCCGLAILASAIAPDARAQGTGDYYNVESPQVKAIAVATVAGRDYVIACNTPDGSVEVYDAVGNAHLQTVRTGAEPISVTWDAASSRFYTANFLGDSVSVVELAPGPGGAPARAKLVRTEHVGDEPMHAAIIPGTSILLVSLGASSALAVVDANSLQPLLGVPLDLLDDFATPTRALKDPRTVATVGTAVLVLGQRGGKSGTGLGRPYDLDLWYIDLLSGGIGTLGGLGTTNLNLTVAANGDLFVVGADAQIQLVGESAASAAPTGFVQTMLYRVRGLGTGGQQVLARDLGRQTTAGGQLGAPVLAADALTQVTDLALFEPAPGTRKLYLAAFSSDRVGVMDATGDLPNAWPVLARIPIAPVSGVPFAMAGPRALAVKYAKPLVPGDPGARVYVLNRLDNSVSAIDPATDTLVATFALRRDPTPAHVKSGRKFLYDARLSQNGFNSCSSCHTDARSDFLAWDLSNGVTVPFDPALDGGMTAPPNPPTWPGQKGRLVTQSLQGMLNAEVRPEVQRFFTNEPLHWRADKRTFEDFNGAFPNLLGAPQLTAFEMAAYRQFVMSIHYPPNPEQDLARRPRGTFGTPNALDGSGAARGIKLSTLRPLTTASPGGTLAGGRSCLQCHEPPEGSENLVTMFDSSTSTPNVLQPLETTSVRLTRVKERRFEKSAVGQSSIATGMFGVGHEGVLDSINDFIDTAFGRDLQGANEVQDVVQLFREWDSGTAPLVGRALTVELATRAIAAPAIAFFENESSKANAGLAVHGRIGGSARGFCFDPTRPAAPYREEPGATTITRAALLALLATSDDRLVFEATPLGSERRIAWVHQGTPPPLVGPQPGQLALEPMPPSPFWSDLPRVTENWDIAGPNPFVWLATTPTPGILRSKRIAQKALIGDGGALGLGIQQPRYEAPRRFAVSGDDIRHGANLVIILTLDPSAVPPSLGSAFTWLWLPIHPTGRTNAQGKPVWETHVELDPLHTYALMLGGFAAPNVAALVTGSFQQEPPAPGSFDPATWNRYWFAVINADGTLGLAFGDRLRLQ